MAALRYFILVVKVKYDKFRNRDDRSMISNVLDLTTLSCSMMHVSGIISDSRSLYDEEHTYIHIETNCMRTV